MIESGYLEENRHLIRKLRQMPTLELFDETTLEGVLKLSKIRQYEAGEMILEEGSYDNRIFFLISGCIQIKKNGSELTRLERAGDVFGEMGIIDGSARSASAYAVDKAVCLSTDISYIDRLAGNDRIAFGYVLFRVFSECLANRLRLTSEALVRAKAEIQNLKQPSEIIDLDLL